MLLIQETDLKIGLLIYVLIKFANLFIFYSIFLGFSYFYIIIDYF